jgi:predicted small metal-binding protein
MGCGLMTVKCDDGFQVVTKDKGELVSVVQWHVDHSHGKKVTEAEVMGMAKHP